MANMKSPGVELYIKDSSYYTSSSSSSIIGLIGGATKGPLVPTLVTNRADAIKIFGEATTDDFGIYSLLGALTQSTSVYYRRIVKESSLATAGDPKVDRLLFESVDEDSTFNNVGIRIEIDPSKRPDPVGTVAVDTMTERDLSTSVLGKKVRDFIGENYEVKLVGDHFYVTGIVNHRDDVVIPEEGYEGQFKGTGYWIVIPLIDEEDPKVVYRTLNGAYKECTLGQTDDGEHRTILLLEIDPENPDSYELQIGDYTYKVLTRFATLRGQQRPPSFNDDQDKFFTLTVKYNDTEEVFENCTLANVEEKVNDVSNYVYVDVNPDDSTVLRNSAYRMSGGGRGASFATTPEDPVINFATKSYDSTMNGAVVELGEQDFFGLFNLYLYAPDGTQLEQLSGLSLEKDNPRFIESYVNANSTYIQCSYAEETHEDVTNRQFKLTGGEDGIDGLSAKEVIEALDDFSNIDEINIDIFCTPGWTDREVINRSMMLCEARQDCIYLIDPPFGLRAQQVTDWSNATGDFSASGSEPFNSSYGAIYWPWVQVFDREKNIHVWLPPSGYVAAQMAYSDSVARQWYAPAGLIRGMMTGITGIEYSPSKDERDLLYGDRNVVNPIMNYRGAGFVIFGQKTTQRNPTALDRVNVRRLVNFIKRVVVDKSAQFIFDMNDHHCWERWVLTIEPELASIQAARGIYDYEVIMDSTTVTQEDIENNRMPGIIRIRPTKTAEFIPITFEIVNSQFQFSTSQEF